MVGRKVTYLSNVDIILVSVNKIANPMLVNAQGSGQLFRWSRRFCAIFHSGCVRCDIALTTNRLTTNGTLIENVPVPVNGFTVPVNGFRNGLLF